jgi:glycerol kinase
MSLDLGSTRFKLGLLDGNGRLSEIFTVAAPALRGDGLIREGEPDDFSSAISDLLARPEIDLTDVPLGLVCQRSTFTVWDQSSGRTLVPMVSWQDRRAANWCDAHPELDEVIVTQTGLLLSPHYVGPKLASMQEQDSNLRAALADGSALFGNLDSWLIWNQTDGEHHVTDVTMASRTALFDIGASMWSPFLLESFNVAWQALPDIMPTSTQAIQLRAGGYLNASISDQAAGVLAVIEPDDDVALVNFGTGAFVLRPVDSPDHRRDGYLIAPVYAANHSPPRFAVEGTINGAGAAIDQFGAGPTALPTIDPCPDGFAIPDQAGVGAPHWRPEIGLTLSMAAQTLSELDQRRVVLEGLLFRVFEILTDLGDGELPQRVLISGGLANDPSIAAGLAALTGVPIAKLEEPEVTLLGAARLAAGLAPYSEPAVRVVHPTDAGAYLRDKYSRWRDWMGAVLSGDSEASKR